VVRTYWATGLQRDTQPAKYTTTHNIARKSEETRSRLDDRFNHRRNVPETTVADGCARLRLSHRKSLRRFSDECG
jgi:hypothetical protein